MEALLLIPALTLGAYLAYIVKRYGIQPSISDSYRVIKHK